MVNFFKSKWKTVLIVILMLAGLSLLVYPLVANSWNSYVQEQILKGYSDSVEELIESGSVDVNSELEAAYAYNEALLPSILPDSFAAAEANGTDQEYEALLNVNGDGTMGYISIPKIRVKLPIFHTTSEEVLEIGVGHLEGSSLPVGGESTHSVLSAHRGLPSASLFTDLDQLEIGDKFEIVILDEHFAYEVDQILVTEPDDTSPLSVEDGADLCTLLTCTPYGVNTQRLMVRGHRVEYVPEVLEDEAAPLFGATSLHTNYVLWVVVGLVIVAIFTAVLFFFDRRRKREESIEVQDS